MQGLNVFAMFWGAGLMVKAVMLLLVGLGGIVLTSVIYKDDQGEQHA